MRNVIVTGGSRGLGLAIGVRLAAGGYHVIAVARHDSEALTAARQTAAVAGRGTLVFRAFDLADTSGLSSLARELRQQYGPVYGLVNNAGIGTSGALGVMPDADIERLVQVNTVAPILLTKYVVRSMMAQSEGRVVNISSVVSATGYTGVSVYSATKAALVGFTRSLAREVGEFGVTVNAIAPGFVATDMTRDLDDAARDAIARRSALRRLTEPADVAHGVEFLLSDGARNITGTVLTIDAGTTA